MKFRNSFRFLIKLIILNQLFTPFFFLNSRVIAETDKIEPNKEYLRNLPNNNFYILGPGDSFSITVNDKAKLLNKTYTVNGEGTANLLRLKRVYIKGLTVGELTNILNKEYKSYVKNPNVDIQILKNRPVRVYINGEVEIPGSYVLRGSSQPEETLEYDKQVENNNKEELLVTRQNGYFNSSYYPTLFDAIRLTGGVSLYSNLEKVIVTRNNSLSNGGGKIRAEIDLLKAISLEDPTQNIRILDGDTIFIPKSKDPIIKEISKAIKSNLNPKFIKVFIGGRVENSGEIIISRQSSLNDAIDISGGPKVIRGPVSFIRYNSDGTLDKRKFKLTKKASRGSYRNPFLNNGDIIVINKSNLNKANEFISEITNPFQGLISTYGLVKVIQD